MSLLRNQEPSLITRLVERVLSRFTFDTGGLRTVAAVSGSLTTVTTVTTCTTVSNANNVALGRINTDGTGLIMTQLNYMQGYRKNLVIT